MNVGPSVATVGTLMGDPARASILCALIDGRAHTATELSYAAGVSPQTTSSHLAKLVDGDLLTLERQGRHRYYRLTSADVAKAIEALLVVSTGRPARHRSIGPRDEGLRQARMCYDHLAGRFGVVLTDAMLKKRYLADGDNGFDLTQTGERFVTGLGIDLEATRRRRRAFALKCLDWSERRHHVAGAVGAALADRLVQLKWVRRMPDSRAVVITRKGKEDLKNILGLSF